MSETELPAAAQRLLDEKAPAAAKTVNVTYIPREQGDPMKTVFAGMTFRAHMPVAVPVDRMMETLKIVTKEMEDGAIHTQGKEAQVRVIDRLKDNPWFLVEGFESAAKRGRPKLPETPEQYRAHALRWIAAAENANDLKNRWAAEQKVRDDCGVTEEDLSQIMLFYYARLEHFEGPEPTGKHIPMMRDDTMTMRGALQR